jgi:uncharacterized Zn finger protein
MQPVELVSRRKGWQVVHRCTRCGKTQPNKVATATNQSDDIEALVGLFRH